MFCPKCGKEIVNGSRFCSMCGARLSEWSQETSSHAADSKEPENKAKNNPAAAFAATIICVLIAFAIANYILGGSGLGNSLSGTYVSSYDVYREVVYHDEITFNRDGTYKLYEASYNKLSTGEYERSGNTVYVYYSQYANGNKTRIEGTINGDTITFNTRQYNVFCYPYKKK